MVLEDEDDDEGPAPSSSEFVLVPALHRDLLSHSLRIAVACHDSCRDSYVAIANAATTTREGSGGQLFQGQV